MYTNPWVSVASVLRLCPLRLLCEGTGGSVFLGLQKGWDRWRGKKVSGSAGGMDLGHPSAPRGSAYLAFWGTVWAVMRQVPAHQVCIKRGEHVGDLCSCLERWPLPLLFKRSMWRSPGGHFSFPIYKSVGSIVTCPCKDIWGGLSHIQCVLCKGAEVQWAVRVAWGRDLGPEPPGLAVFIGSGKPWRLWSFPSLRPVFAPRGER